MSSSFLAGAIAVLGSAVLAFVLLRDRKTDAPDEQSDHLALVSDAH
jgi:hypothetical protein